eukprot:scaffold6519_cov156-Ochromonas_danica.AAC.3
MVREACNVTSQSKLGELKKRWKVQAQRPEVCEGSIAHDKPFQRGLPLTSAYSHTNFMASSHSRMDETCTVHVG